MKKGLLKVRFQGSSTAEEFDVEKHEILAFPASTYHELTFPDGRVLLVNDFGIRTVGLRYPDEEDS